MKLPLLELGATVLFVWDVGILAASASEVVEEAPEVNASYERWDTILELQ